jgi:hypothetical protein
MEQAASRVRTAASTHGRARSSGAMRRHTTTAASAASGSASRGSTRRSAKPGSTQARATNAPW